MGRDGDGGEEENYEDGRRSSGSVVRFRTAMRDVNPGGSGAVLVGGGAILDGDAGRRL
jgi:hypothetical protein